MTDSVDTPTPEEPVRAVFALGLMDTLSDADLAEQVIEHSEAPIELALAWRLLAATQKLATVQEGLVAAIEEHARANAGR